MKPAKYWENEFLNKNIVTYREGRFEDFIKRVQDDVLNSMGANHGSRDSNQDEHSQST